MKAYVVYDNILVTADSYQELVKKLAHDLKYAHLGMSDFEVPNIERTYENDPKEKLYKDAQALLAANREQMLKANYEDIFSSEEKSSAYFKLYFDCIDAGLDKDEYWYKAVNHLGSELQI